MTQATPNPADEEGYLKRYPDVRAAVAQGHFHSGRAHFEQFGRHEGRQWRPGEMPTVKKPPYERLAELLDLKNWGWLDYAHRGHHVKTQSPADTREMLLREALRLHNGCIVEIGVFGGASLLHLAQATAAQGNLLYGIDPWEKIESINGLPLTDAHDDIRVFMAELRTNLQHIVQTLDYTHVHLVAETSEKAAGHFKDKSIDLLFMDGGHGFEQVSLDLAKYLPKMKPGGLILGDDFDWPGVKGAVDHFCAMHRLEIGGRGRVCRLHVPQEH